MEPEVAPVSVRPESGTANGNSDYGGYGCSR